VKKYCILFSVLGLAACGSTDPQVVGPYPADYRELVREAARQAYFDPYSMRDVRIATPREGRVYFDRGWVVCLQANARNRMGAYTGLQYTAFLIRDGRVVNATELPQCSGADGWQEFAVAERR
jgi:hypothetical protein